MTRSDFSFYKPFRKYITPKGRECSLPALVCVLSPFCRRSMPFIWLVSPFAPHILSVNASVGRRKHQRKTARMMAVRKWICKGGMTWQPINYPLSWTFDTAFRSHQAWRYRRASGRVGWRNKKHRCPLWRQNAHRYAKFFSEIAKIDLKWAIIVLYKGIFYL